MTDEVIDSATATQVIPDSGAAANSVGAGQPPAPEVAKPEPAPAKLSTRDAISKAFDDEDSKAQAKGADVEKPAPKEADKASVKSDGSDEDDADGKEVLKNKTGGSEDQTAAKNSKDAAPKAASGQADDQADVRRSEGKRYAEPPARFLPEARAKWASVPNDIKAEFHRISKEFDDQTGSNKEALERYQAIKHFDDVVRANGRELKDSLSKMFEIEQTLAKNPVAALHSILQEAGPRKADGTPVSLYELAQYVVQQGPQAAQRLSSAPIQQAAVAPQANNEINALRAEIQSMKAEQTIVPVVQEFAARHPDFDSLSPQIEAILKSGVIENIYGPGLSLEQKLAESFRMAGGRSPSNSVQPQPVDDEDTGPKAARLVDPDGQKSIKGSPSGGQNPDPKWRPKSNRDALERAFAGLR